MGFQLVPKLVTINDLEWRIMAITLHYFIEFGSFQDPLRKSG